MQFKQVSFIVHSAIVILFIYFESSSYFLMALGPFLHYLVLKYDSSCYKNHCKILIERKFGEERLCQNCKLDEWIRMRHCYKCNQCIHKFDHHCVLMGICIGEFNHKYYLLFLYSYTCNIIGMMLCFHSSIINQVTLDEYGIEHLSLKYYFYSICLIMLYFNLFLGLYLSFYHTIFTLNNQTTWQRAKRYSISYLKNISQTNKYPFSQGYINNLKQFFCAHPDRPIKWEVIR